MLSRKPALVQYVTEGNENECLNLECFRARVPRWKEGYLTSLTSALPLGNRYYISSKVTAAGSVEISQRWINGVGDGGHGEAHTPNACSTFRAHYTPGSTSKACSGGSSKSSAAPLNQGRARTGHPYSLWEDIVTLYLPIYLYAVPSVELNRLCGPQEKTTFCLTWKYSYLISENTFGYLEDLWLVLLLW